MPRVRRGDRTPTYGAAATAGTDDSSVDTDGQRASDVTTTDHSSSTGTDTANTAPTDIITTTPPSEQHRPPPACTATTSSGRSRRSRARGCGSSHPRDG